MPVFAGMTRARKNVPTKSRTPASLRGGGGSRRDSALRSLQLTQPSARMREQEIDASRLRGEIVLQHASRGIARLGFAKQAFEIGDVAVHGKPEFVLVAVAASDFIERGLTVGIVYLASEHAAVSGPEALPELRRRAVIDGAGDLVETELTALLRGRRVACCHALNALVGRPGCARLRRRRRARGVRGAGQLLGKTARHFSDIAALRLSRLPSARVEMGEGLGRTELRLSLAWRLRLTVGLGRRRLERRGPV